MQKVVFATRRVRLLKLFPYLGRPGKSRMVTSVWKRFLPQPKRWWKGVTSGLILSSPRLPT